MKNYKKMYFELFNQVEDAIKILKYAQKRSEEIYVTEKEKKDEALKNILIMKK